MNLTEIGTRTCLCQDQTLKEGLSPIASHSSSWLAFRVRLFGAQVLHQNMLVACFWHDLGMVGTSHVIRCDCG